MFIGQKGPVANQVHCDHMCSAISDLSCYITMYLQNMGQEQETVGQESLTTTILADLLFPHRRSER